MKSNLWNSKATAILILANIVIFAALNASPDLADIFLLNPDLIAERPWSLLTAFFSHELFIHILLNMLLLFIFGTRLENEANEGLLLGVYVLCGLVGSLSSVAYAAVIGFQGGPIAGASASAFGVAAAFAALKPDTVILKSKAVHWVAALFVVNALLTVQNPQVSVGGPAHAAGIVLGLAFGYALRRRQGTMGPKGQRS
ncbi:MAG TPA: rhomboid family intramembrane serine protease [Firmicutes bacterium]|jgi:membrane associated rhomboid family serine protease|nr:rhomboid family intramembrane serine protease [Bacillota bacterium]